MNKLTVKIITDANADARFNNPDIYRTNTIYLHAFIAERAATVRNTYPSLVCLHPQLTGDVLEDIKDLRLDRFHLNGVYAMRDFVNPLVVTIDAWGNIRDVAGLDMQVDGYTYSQFAYELQRCIRKNVTMLVIKPPSTIGDAEYAPEKV